MSDTDSFCLCCNHKIGNDCLGDGNINVVYGELQEISDQLKEKSRFILEWEEEIRRREHSLSIREDAILQNQQRLDQDFEQEAFMQQGSRAQDLLLEKSKEVKRLADNFDVVKQSNEHLRLQCDALIKENKLLKEANSRLEARLINLQRKLEFSERRAAASDEPLAAADGAGGDPTAEPRRRRRRGTPSVLSLSDRENRRMYRSDENLHTARSRQPSAAAGGGDLKGYRHTAGKLALSQSTAAAVAASTAQQRDVIGTCLEWLVEADLRPSALRMLSASGGNPSDSAAAARLARCTQLLPALVSIVRNDPALSDTCVHHHLGAIYWIILILDNCQQPQASFVSTLRRLGEDLYKPKSLPPRSSSEAEPAHPGAAEPGAAPLSARVPLTSTVLEPDNSVSPPPRPLSSASVPFSVPSSIALHSVTDGGASAYGAPGTTMAAAAQTQPPAVRRAFFRSANLHSRLISSLLILKTLSQVDRVVQVFETLRHDLKSDPAKNLFLQYHATHLLCQFLRSQNRLICQNVCDLHLLMCADGPHQTAFLQSCSTDVWFRACNLCLRSPNTEPSHIEKLSVVLQKLSRIGSNKKLFDLMGISSFCNELVKSSAKKDNAFLGVNIKSILLNLGGAKQ